METALIALVVLIVVGAVLGLVIGLAGKFFAVKSDPRIEKVTEMLPGANCGGCGRAGCADFAKALCAGEALPGGCPASSPEAVENIASFLGIAAGAGEKKVAVVLCGGDKTNARQAALYNGVSDCISASLIGGGAKGCTYGCLGLGSCMRACPFNAIELVNGLAVVHSEICTGCGSCVDKCPRKLIKLVPKSAEIHVYCSSPEKGPTKKKVC
ncbi:MAG: (Fe-S)-binding protein, partial [Victivallales bacterium]|nr:(Fe-S)-binding protein [Victivallales bacterium]